MSQRHTRRTSAGRSPFGFWALCTIIILVVGAGTMSAALAPLSPQKAKQRARTNASVSSAERSSVATSPARAPKGEPILLAQAAPSGGHNDGGADKTQAAQKPADEPVGPPEYGVLKLDPRTVPPSQPDNFLSDQRAMAQGPIAEQEPNDTPATATPLGGTNVVARGNIYKLGLPPGSATGDLDYWSFAAAAGDKVYAATITQFAPSSSTDTTLELFASDGTTILETDLDDGSLTASSSSIAGANIPVAGTYYLRVRHASNSSRIAPYFLHFRLQSGSPTPEAESNDTAATANPLPANGWVSGTHGAATDADFFFFSANAGDTIYLSLDADPERDNVQWNPRVGIGLFGDTSNLILVVDDASTGTATNPLSEAHVLTVKTTGTYYAYVDTTAQTSGGPTQTYNLSVSVHPATPIGTSCTVYTSADVPKTIGPGAGSVDSTITIPGSPRIEDVNVSVTLSHALMADVDAAIVTPAGNENSLFTDIGATATGGQTQLDADFDDEAGIPAVFTALKGEGWQPETSYRLAWLKGENAGGTWTLRLRDDVTNTSGGTLTAWSITVCEPPAPAVCSGTLVNVFSTDFEAGTAGFTHSGTGDQWARGLPTAAPITTCNSGTNCFKTNLTGTYAPSSNQDLFSPNISLSGLAAPIRVSWAQRYQIESASFDEYYADIREPGPTNSRVLFQWLDATMTDSVGSPAVTINESAGWGVVTANADAYANKAAVQLHWNLAPDSSVNLGGVAIDDVTVTACCTAASCNDNNPCTDDVCDAVLGCTHVNNTASCSDGNPCTGPDVCSGGTCVPGPNPCNDGDPCTNDICDGAGGCTYTPVSCDDANPCTDDSCTPASGCIHAPNNAPCSDSNPCTVGDICSGGACVPGPVPPPVQFCSSGAVLVPAGQPTTTVGIGSPYPSTITVTGLPSYLCSVTVNLNNVTHTFIADVDLLLARSAGNNAVIMSDVGGTTGVTGVNLTLDDAAAASLPGGAIVSGTYKPTDLTPGDPFASPAPAPTGGSALAAFVGGNPNGAWNLWAVDDASGDVGSIGSWCVNVRSACQTAADCSDGNPCTDDACTNGGCTHANNTAACDDGNACTSNDTCAGGTCVGGAPPSCDDGDVCTADHCNPTTGQCDHVAVVCNDNNPCTDDSCVGPSTGCQYVANDANSCSDGNACTQADACVNGQCVGSNPVPCDDGNVCTTDTCDPATGGCVHANNTAPCDDGDACTTGDVCAPRLAESFDAAIAPEIPGTWTTTLVTGVAGDLPWTTETTSFDTPPNSAFADDPAHITDKVLDSPPIAIASAAAKLTFKNRFVLESGFDGGVLEISIGGGPFADIVTAGGSFASGGYTGTISTAWQSPIAGRQAWTGTNTGNPAYLTTTVNLPAAAAGQSVVLRWRVASDVSVSATGQNVDSIVLVDPTNVCTPGDPTDCDDHNACTTDTCDPASGCLHDPVNCIDDHNPCTTDTCDPELGCLFLPNTEPCDDGNACTVGDVCDGGLCQPGGPIACDDGNVCTDNLCDSVSGCYYPSNTAPCNDGNACTTGDTCGGGICHPGGPTNCDDGNVCTDDTCVAPTGCVHTNNTAPCDDGNPCTVDQCSGGVCGCTLAEGICQGQTAHFDSSDVPKPIPTTVATVTSTVTVAGLGAYLADVNVKTFITHTNNGDLQITIKSPAGTIVTLTSNNGGTADDVFNGTLWDDDADPGSQVPYTTPLATSNIVSDTAFTNLVVRPTLAPEEALGAFKGENPNGVWTLTIADTATANGGNLANWSLDLTTYAQAPTAAVVTYPSTDVPKTIPTTAPPNVVTSTVTVAGAGTAIGNVRIKEFILHTFNGDIDMTLKSPAGTVVTLTTDNGSLNDNVFNGTTWDDKADPGNQVPYTVPLATSNMASDAVYANNVVKPTLVGEEGLAAFDGEDPNGTWTLTISDDANLDGGSLQSWSLEVTTITCRASCQTNCDDANPCTDDTCDPAVGCVHTNNTSPCNDGQLCTVGDTCSGGACVGTPVVCDDQNVCTDDTCNPATGLCVFANNTNTCDDGNACTSGDTCGATTCNSLTETFDGVTAPAIPATWTATVVVGTAADNWVTSTTSTSTPPNAAFTNDVAGIRDKVLDSPPILVDFTGGQVTFRNNFNTESTFDGEVLEIKIGAGAFQDIIAAGGSFVTGGYNATISTGFSSPIAGRSAWSGSSGGFITSTVNLPAAAHGQTIQLRWRVASDVSVAATGVFIDNVFVGGTCPPNHCQGTTISCDDGNPCTDDTCNPASGCVHTNNTSPCNDGNACTTNDTCGGGICNGGPAPSCDDGNPCTTDTCDPASGCHSTNNTNPCDDGNACTTNDTCGGGTCNGGPAPSCDDGNVCTDDTCNPSSGCVHTSNTNPCDDGNACTSGDVCGGGTCHAGAPVVCGDNNPCTDDSCNPASGCVFTNNTGPCNDGNACTTNDTCGGGSCHGGAPPSCDDGNVCTTDGCNPASGCTHTNNTDPCDDGNACTTSDTCGGGSCHGGAPPNCDDGNVCTTDGCNPASGCTHTNNTNPCDDGNACTTNDACSGGSCHGGPALNCDDGNCCTVDTCNPSTGCAHAPYTVPPTIVDQPDLDGGGGSCPVLWPPSHSYVDFTVADTGIQAQAVCGGLTYRFASCDSSQQENATGIGEGNTNRDCVYEPGALHLRAERDGACSPKGRTYTMTMIVTDACGNSTVSAPFTSCVWHDHAHGPNPANGRIYSAPQGSNPNDTRTGTNGTYGAACGDGCGLVCGESGQVHDSSDDDRPALRISTLADGTTRLDWTLPAPGDPYPPNADYEIWRKVHGPGPFTKIGQVSHSVSTFNDTTAQPGVNYDYSVNALY